MVNLNYDKMREICLAPLSYFWGLGRKVEINGRWYVFIDNGGTTLAVAHLDSVISNNTVNHFHVSKYNAFLAQYISTIYNAQLDDRLGAYIILDLLPKHIGNSYDILLCNDEESGRSTANLFDAKELGVENRYNWIFEFDATGGNEAKTYSYGDTDFHNKLKEHGFSPAHGSYTDICHLTGLGVKAVNIACGYYQYHSQTAYALVQDVVLQVERFLSFHLNYKDIQLPHTPKQFAYQNYHGWKDGVYKFNYDYGRTPIRASIQSAIKGTRPTNFDWMNDASQYYKYSIVKGNIKYDTYDHKDSGNPASHCCICGNPHWIDDLDFVELGMPVCDHCSGVKGAKFFSDDIVWMLEGGYMLRYTDDDLWSRKVFAGTSKDDYVICPICNEPEWTKYATVDGTCRVCVEAFKYESNAFKRVLPDGTVYEHTSQFVICSDCDKKIDLSVCTIDELECFDTYGMCKACVDFHKAKGNIE